MASTLGFYTPGGVHGALIRPEALPTPRPLDFTLDDVYLHGRGGGGMLNVGASITGADLELTIEGASTLTLTIEDPEKAILRSDLLTRWTWGASDLGNDTWVVKGRAVDVRLVDDVWFRLVKVRKAGTTLTLTFEDRVIAFLRQHRGTVKASRAKSTRAEFILKLARRVKASPIRFYCPALHEKQPIEKATQKKKKHTKRASAAKGLNGSGLTVKGQPATDTQIGLLERCLDVADSLDAPPRARLALIVAVIQESVVSNGSETDYNDHDSRGILQVRDQTARGMGIDNKDVEQCVKAFLTRGFWGKGGAIALSRKNPGAGADWIAQQTQGSAVPAGYTPWLPEGRKILEAYEGGGGRADGEKDTYNKPYEYAVNQDEDYWTAGTRLANEVAWRLFVRQGTLWYISEDDLFRQRAEMVVREGEDGVDHLDWDLDTDSVDLTTTVTAQVRIADGWTAWPGMAVIVEGEGPADGRYLVAGIRRSLVDKTGAAEVTLRRPIPPKPEPRPEEVQRAETGDDDGSTGDGKGTEAVYDAAKHISSQNRPYVYGGGHSKPLSQITPSEGLDCSSSTSLALKRGGMFDGENALVSGAFAASWGQPGKGKHMTVWANAEHVWIEFHDHKERFDTSPHGAGPSGPHVRPMNRGTGGFTPRHWPGT